MFSRAYLFLAKSATGCLFYKTRDQRVKFKFGSFRPANSRALALPPVLVRPPANNIGE